MRRITWAKIQARLDDYFFPRSLIWTLKLYAKFSERRGDATAEQVAGAAHIGGWTLAGAVWYLACRADRYYRNGTAVLFRNYHSRESDGIAVAVRRTGLGRYSGRKQSPA